MSNECDNFWSLCARRVTVELVGIALVLVCAVPITAIAESFEESDLDAPGWVHSESPKGAPNTSSHGHKTEVRATSSALATPGGLVIDPPLINVGDIQPDEVHHYEAVLANAGDTTVPIRRARTSCACITAVVGTNELAPGESTSIRVTIQTPQTHGTSFHQTVSIASRATSRRSYFVIRGETTPMVAAAVRPIACNATSSTLRFTVSLEALDDHPFQIRNIDRGRFVAVHDDVATNHVVEFDLDLDGSGAIPRSVNLNIDHPSQSNVQLRLDTIGSESQRENVLANVKFAPRELIVTPSSVDFGLMRVGDIQRRAFLIPEWPRDMIPEIQTQSRAVTTVIESTHWVEDGLYIAIAFTSKEEDVSYQSEFVFIGDSIEAPFLAHGRIARVNSK